MRRRPLLAFLLSLIVPVSFPAMAGGDGLIEPTLRIGEGGPNAPRVALTLDACMGEVDLRILDMLVQHQISATLFVTGRWLTHNAEAVRTLLAHPELFQLENHGAMHVPAVLGTNKVFGIEPAGTLQAVEAEVSGGAAAMQACGIDKANWYRDATALYSPEALAQIRQMGFRIGGFSLNADFGASLPAEKVAERIAAAMDGDVIIGHINQPRRSSGAGLAAGVLALKDRGFSFVRLNDVAELHAWGEEISPAATPQTAGHVTTALTGHKARSRPPAL